MLLFRRFVTAGCIFLFHTAMPFHKARAQNPVTLPAVLDLLQQNAPSLARDAAAIGIFEQRLQATRYNWWPNLQVNTQVALGTNNNLPGGFFGNGLVPGNSRVKEEGSPRTLLTDLGVASFDWEVYNFGAYEARNKVAASDLKVQQLNYELSRYELQQVGIDVYLRLILLKEMMGLQEQNIQRNTEIKNSIRALVISGVKAGVDTSIAEAEISKARLLKLELVNQYRQLLLQLSFLTALPADDIVVDTLIENKVIAHYMSFLSNRKEAESHPLLEYYTAVQENSAERENQIRKEYLPKVLLQASVWGRGSSLSALNEYRPLYGGLGIERLNYLVGMGITYNIFDYKRKQLQLNVQKATTQHAGKLLQEQKAQLENNLYRSRVELTTAYERLQEIPRQLDAASAAYRQKLALYKNGLTNITELNVALSILYRAETDYAQVKFSFSKAAFENALIKNQLPELFQILN